MRNVPKELLAKLPSPSGFEQFPEYVQRQLLVVSYTFIQKLLYIKKLNKIIKVHQNSSLSWDDKHKQITQIINSLPEEDRVKSPPEEDLNFPPLVSNFLFKNENFFVYLK